MDALKNPYLVEVYAMPFWRRKQTTPSHQPGWVSIRAPFTGRVIPLSEVPDPVFAQKMVGDGAAVIPESDVLLAPVTGTLTHLFPTGHAAGITTEDGLEILVHIGINTVELKGDGFTLLSNRGERIEAGKPIIRIDLEKLRRTANSMVTPVVVTNMEKVEQIKPAEPSVVRAGADVLLRVLPKPAGRR
jgi:glucose-specific phosphotransferase system IIA component